MKTKVNPPNGYDYPCYLIHMNQPTLVLYATSKNEGVIVASAADHCVGETLRDLNLSCWRPLTKEDTHVFVTPIKYPCLMKSKQNGTIVLFTASTKGTVVRSGDIEQEPVGYTSVGWAMSFFLPFEGTLELSNKS